MSHIHTGRDHDRDNGHGHSHDPAHTPGPGHNRDVAAPTHLHSHMAPEDDMEDLQVLASQFIDGFREARDKAAYLRLAGIPLEIEDEGGGPPLKLVDLSLTTQWQVGTASPSFGSRDLSYLPFPGPMIRERETFTFVYVSLDHRVERDIWAFLKEKMG